MAYYPYPGYQPAYYPQPVPDQLAQLRQNQMPQMVQQAPTLPMQAQPPQTVQPMPPAPAAAQSSGIIWVASRQEADAYLVAPGSAVALWDANSPVIYLRQADGTGKPSTKVYDLVERTDGQRPQAPPPIDLTQYVTRDELESILAERLKRPSKAAQKKEDTDNG